MRFSLGVLLACGLGAGWSLGGLVPDGLVELCDREVVDRPFELTEPARVTEQRWFFLPQLWGDFDLQMDLELGEGAEVDVLLRQVEPRFVDEVMVPFTGRFSTLRISSEGDGPGWRSREAALFGPRGGGVGVEPGRPATVWIEARGATLTANVSGKRQATLEADDVYGMFTVLVRGGDAVIHGLRIDARPIAGLWRWQKWAWIAAGAAAALLVAAAASLLSERPPLGVAGGALLGVTVVLCRGVELPLLFPDVAVMVSMLAGATVVAVLVAALRGRASLVATLPLAVALLALGIGPQWFAGHVARSLGQSASAEVDAVFGADSGEQPSKALGQLVRTPRAIVDREKRGRRVFLLGGEWLYNRAAPSDQIGLQLGAKLRAAFGPGAEALSLPTVEAYSAQQWRLFDGFYQGFEPDVLVFGVGATDAGRDPETGELLTSPDDLRQTLARVRDDCDARDRGLVLFVDTGTTRALREVVRGFAGARYPVVELTDELPRAEVARRLFDAVEPLLR